MIVTTRDGRLLASGDTHARGGPEAPLSEAEIEAKFMELSTPVLGQTRSAAIAKAVLSLAEPGARFGRAFGAYLRRPFRRGLTCRWVC